MVLVDALSASSSEEFAGGLQALGRATVVGERTAGIVLIADVVPLGDDATLVLPVAEASLADGRRLEGVGVVPDILAPLSRAALLDGRDPQLDAALRFVQGQLDS